MGKRHSIAAKKASGDQAKARNYSKIGKIIQLAAKNGSDPSMNPSLELALQKAKYHNLPKDVVDKAIKKGSGQLKSEDLQEIIYEGYGPGGVAILIKTLTDNTNRTSSNIKIILYKFGGSLGEPGSVSWQFNQKGTFIIDGKFEIIKEKGNDIRKTYPLNIEESEIDLMDMDVEDIDREDEKLIITVEKNNFVSVRNILIDKKYNLIDSDLHYILENTLEISDEDKIKLSDLIDNLQEDEDVDIVYSNVK
ncbi:MAG TPA: YebC/PmpR family DNA-binding transcriptional regulator [Candidatus Absconditabacterales bacterium]|nr:YebC/PmpR family DNA-binding transcriptional regulator [Candidatus Absconditabacterales bacterium]